MSLTVSFIVPALNEATMLARLLASIDSLVAAEYATVMEVIVVDADSSDNTADIARSRGCRLLTAERGSVARSRNLGAAAAQGNLLAFVDADCELASDWLVRIAANLAPDDVVAVGCAMKAPPADAPWVERTWFELAHRSQVHGAEEVRWLATFNLAVRERAFEAAGGFNEDLVTCEDVDFGYRLSKFGRLVQEHATHVAHHGESKTLAEFFRRESWRARGALLSVRSHWQDIRELVSFAAPIVVTLLAFLGLVLLVMSAMTAPAQLALVIAGVGLVVLPSTLLALRRRVSAGLFGQGALLMAAYCAARTIGLLRSFPRVERKEEQKGEVH